MVAFGADSSCFSGLGVPLSLEPRRTPSAVGPEECVRSPALEWPLSAGSEIQWRMKRVRSRQPISRSALANTEFWNEELQSFVQTKNGKTLDAACLLAPLVRFISPTDPRWLSTLRAIGGRASGRLTGLSIQDRRWPNRERRNLLHAFLLAGWFPSRCTFFKPGGRAFIQRILQDV